MGTIILYDSFKFAMFLPHDSPDIFEFVKVQVNRNDLISYPRPWESSCSYYGTQVLLVLREVG